MFTKRRVAALLAVLVIAILVPLSASAQTRPSGTATSVAGAASVAQLADAAKTLEAIQLSFREIAKKVLPGRGQGRRDRGGEACRPAAASSRPSGSSSEPPGDDGEDGTDAAEDSR